MSRVKLKTAPPPARVPVRRGMARIAPALRVGSATDRAERQAEAMAARVVASAGPTPHLDRTSEMRRAATDQPSLDELKEPPVPADQADFDLPSSQDVSTEGLGGDDVSEIEGGSPVDTAGDPPPPEDPPRDDAPPPVARAPAEPRAVVGREGGPAPSDVAARVMSPGAGRPLSRALVARVGPHFGRDFSEVRVHDASGDQAAAARIGARAFTHGRDIWLGRGESDGDVRLMAHELTHVVQQTDGERTLPREIRREPGWLARKAEKYARHVPGYTLVTVILGETLITGETVRRTPENLLGGLLGLLPGGEAIFQKLKDAQILQDAWTWLQTKLSELNITWARIRGLLSKLDDAIFSTSPIENTKRLFRPLYNDIVSFIKAVVIKVLEFVIRGALKLAGPFADKVWGVIQRAGAVLKTILEDPLGFAKNLIAAVVGGFKLFGKNIIAHLKKGLLGWLFGAISKIGITLPAKLDFKGLMSIVLQVLGLTYAEFRKQLVKRLGPKGEKMVSFVEKSVEIVKILLKEGFVGIWQKLLELIEGFKEKLIGSIQNLVVKSIVEAGLKQLAMLANPIGAIVKVVLAIYKMIKLFIERIQQIADVAESIFSSIGEIASGRVSAAARFVEESIARTVPVVIAFIAAMLDLDKLPARVRELIERLRAPIRSAMDRLIGFVVKKAKALFSKIIGKLNRKRAMPSVNFKVGRATHRIFALERKGRVEVRIASGEGHDVDEVRACHAEQLPLIEDKAAQTTASGIAEETTQTDTETDAKAKKVKPADEKENQLGPLQNLQKAFQENAKEIEAAGLRTDEDPHISSDTSDRPCLFRAAEPRDFKFEGTAGDHATLLAAAQEPMPSGGGRPRSQFYQADHTIEKSFARAIIGNLDRFKAGSDKEQRSPAELAGIGPAEGRIYRSRGPIVGKLGSAKDKEARVEKGGAKLGKFESIDATGKHLPAIALYHLHHDPAKASGRVAPGDLVEASRARNPNEPVAGLKAILKEQLVHESGLITAAMAEDRVATPEVRSRIKAALDETIRTMNTEIFGLGDVPETKAPPPPEAKTPYGPADFPMSGGPVGNKGEKTVPNFLDVEGVGVPYAQRTSGIRGYLEYDHIIDKQYPKDVQDDRLVADDRKKKVEEQAEKLTADERQKGEKGSAGLSDEQRARLREVVRTPLFEGLPIRSYTDDTGYSIPLYKALATEVTARTGSGAPAVIASTVPDKAMFDVARYVARGDEAALHFGRDQARLAYRKAFLARTDAHSRHVADLYAKDVKRVPSINPPESQGQARQAIQKIAGNVLASLQQARKHTEDLFR